ncbi:hypothetical protein PM082_019497 [Marasmius tenuissimus]|nr:hypothetical protein PM082_019497 [Marasmius tenuissimus]
MSLRAYYRNPTAGDLSLPQDSGRPVSEKKLRALGCKWWLVEGSLDQRMEKFKELSKSLGFEDGDREHFFDLSNEAAGTPGNLALAPKAILESWKQDNKDPDTNSFIRIAVPPEYAIFYPSGTIFQASSHEANLLDISFFVLFKSKDSASVFTPGEELDQHPARVDYVQRVLYGDLKI